MGKDRKEELKASSEAVAALEKADRVYKEAKIKKRKFEELKKRQNDNNKQIYDPIDADIKIEALSVIEEIALGDLKELENIVTNKSNRRWKVIQDIKIEDPKFLEKDNGNAQEQSLQNRYDRALKDIEGKIYLVTSNDAGTIGKELISLDEIKARLGKKERNLILDKIKDDASSLLQMSLREKNGGKMLFAAEKKEKEEEQRQDKRANYVKSSGKTTN